MVFLDRKVGNTNVLIAAFWSIVCSILCSSTKVFLRYFPVEESTECLEKDSYGRSLFCYNHSSFPVDCANFSLTELRELQFQCYAIALPAGLGIAVAAALGLAKVAIVGVTIFVKVTEGFFMITKNPPRKLQEVCCRKCVSRKCANGSCRCISIAFLIIVSAFTLCLGIFFAFTSDLPILHVLYNLAYAFLLGLICVPLMGVIHYLLDHDEEGEYISIAPEQRPPDPRDWDVESESDGEHDETSNAGESCNTSGEVPNETQEISVQFHDSNGNTE